MIPSLIYLDRYRNGNTRTYSTHADYTEAFDRYRPDSRHEQFELSVWALPIDSALLYTANPPKQLAATYLRDDMVLFCVHPQVVEQCGDDPYLQQVMATGSPVAVISVCPSSSTRTVYVADHGVPHAIKVHFPFRISRYGRKMRDEVIEQAVTVSHDLEQGIGALDQRFAFLREVIGVAQPNLQNNQQRSENWGYIVRDMQPFPASQEQRELIPGFALYGKDYFDSATPPLLYELIGSQDPLNFVLETIMLPIVRHWAGCFLNFGYLLEPHGQNVLLEANAAGSIERIVHRDLSLGIDMRLRRASNMDNSRLNRYNRMESGEFNSITYDMFMGSHFFDRILSCCLEHYPGLTAEDFREPCRREFAKVFPDHASYLPATVHYFSEKRDKFNKPLYRDTGRLPDWRPVQVS